MPEYDLSNTVVHASEKEDKEGKTNDTPSDQVLEVD